MRWNGKGNRSANSTFKFNAKIIPAILLTETRPKSDLNPNPKIAPDFQPCKPKLTSVSVLPQEKDNGTRKDDLFLKIRSFLIIGKFLGVVPISGVFKKRSYSELTFQPYSISALINSGVTFILFVNFLLELFQATNVSKANAVELAVAIKSPIYYGYGVFIYIYFLLRANKVIDLFHTWARTKTTYSRPDKHLSRYVLTLSSVVLTSAILENVILHFKYFSIFDNFNDVVYLGYNERLGGRDPQTSILEIFYRRLHFDFSGILGYNHLFAVLVFVANKLTLYSWNYVDLFLCMCGRALYFRFKALYEVSKLKLVPTSETDPRSGAKWDREVELKWNQIVKDHYALCNLLREFEALVSPLIFLSFVINIFYTCMQVYMGLHTEDSGPQSLIHSIYAPWSLIQLGVRTYLVSITLARVNSYAHKIMDVIVECPTQYYDKNMSRFDRNITCGRAIGFSGWGYFIVNKPFILKVVGVIFTFEIVLLQGSSSSPHHPQSSSSFTPNQNECCCHNQI